MIQRLVYIAGPFRSANTHGAPDMFGVQHNVMQAMRVALSVWTAGHVAICPHANTMFFTGANGLEDLVWLKGDLLMLDRCDAVLTVPGWVQSQGAREEVIFAKGRGIPVYFGLDHMKRDFAEHAEEINGIRVPPTIVTHEYIMQHAARSERF